MEQKYSVHETFNGNWIKMKKKNPNNERIVVLRAFVFIEHQFV